MKELKNRIKGLSAIFLAVGLALCLVMRLSGVKASAAVITTGNNGTDTKLTDCVGLTFSAIGDGLEYGSSGGYFAIAYKSGDENIAEYLEIENSITTNDGNYITYYDGVKVKKTLPDNYESIIITDCTKVTCTNADGSTAEVNAADYYPIYELTFEWVPKTTISVGIPMAMTAGTQYAFPSGSSTHKVQGDPTVYYGTSFYVSSSGTYTIEQ